MDMDEAFSSIDLVTQCLTDRKRTERFQEAINRVVKPGDVVLDSGTGSAVLALMAARAGAQKVYAIEYDPFIAKIAAQNVARNGFSDVVDIVVGDVRNVNFSEGTVFDVVIMEMLTTGMIDEYQVWTMNNLHRKGYVNSETRFLPERQDTFVQLTQADYTNYGFDMRMVRHVWEPHSVIEQKPFTSTELLNSVPFNAIHALTSDSTIVFTATDDGIVNSVHVTSITQLDSELTVSDTAALNAPVVWPLDEDIEVRKGDRLELVLQYQFGGGFRNFNASVRKL